MTVVDSLLSTRRYFEINVTKKKRPTLILLLCFLVIAFAFVAFFFFLVHFMKLHLNISCNSIWDTKWQAVLCIILMVRCLDVQCRDCLQKLIDISTNDDKCLKPWLGFFCFSFCFGISWLPWLKLKVMNPHVLWNQFHW